MILYSSEEVVSHAMSICIHVFTVFNRMIHLLEKITKSCIIALAIIFCCLLSALSLRHSHLKCNDHRCRSGHIISLGRWITLLWGANYPVFCRAHVQMPCPEVPRVWKSHGRILRASHRQTKLIELCKKTLWRLFAFAPIIWSSWFREKRRRSQRNYCNISGSPTVWNLQSDFRILTPSATVSPRQG